MLEIKSYQQYEVLKTKGPGVLIFSVWEPVDTEAQYEHVRQFNKGVYGLVGTRLTSIENKQEASQFILEQIARAKEIVTKVYPDIQQNNLKRGPLAYMLHTDN